MNLKALPNRVLVTDLEFGERQTSGGIILQSDDGTNAGVRPRWGRVYSIGENIKDIEEGDWILIKHGRWTRKVEVNFDDKVIPIWKVEYPESVLAFSKDKPTDDTLLDNV